jgi:hypothetical protein
MSTHMCLDCDSPGDGNCPACHGFGKLPGESALDTHGQPGTRMSCSYCNGSGECQKCDGSGEVEVGGEG